MKQRLNFAPKPFVFHSAKTLLLWVLNLLALLALGWLVFRWSDLRSQNATAHQAIGELQQQRLSLIDRHQTMLDQIERIDFRDYRRQMTLFQGIQTSFSIQWGPLLDELAALMPEDVRMIELKPASRDMNQATTGVVLEMRGEARTKTSQLSFLETLENHPRFSNVVFDNEAYDNPSVAVSFEIQFRFEPGGGS